MSTPHATPQKISAALDLLCFLCVALLAISMVSSVGYTGSGYGSGGEDRDDRTMRSMDATMVKRNAGTGLSFMCRCAKTISSPLITNAPPTPAATKSRITVSALVIGLVLILTMPGALPARARTVARAMKMARVIVPQVTVVLIVNVPLTSVLLNLASSNSVLVGLCRCAKLFPAKA